jgi:hypothetical protein
MTRETTPWHIWFDNVCTAAIAAGTDGAIVQELKPTALKWYQAGEPVWMAADGLRFVAKRRVIEARAERETNGLRARIRARCE